MTGAEKDEKIQALERENQALRERIAELERRMGLNSENSSRPPSSDGLKKKTHRTKSLRGKSNRKKGGQKGHRGYTLEQVAEPDKLVKHLAPDSCWGCGYDSSQEQVISVIKRQVFDIPEPRIEVTEHQVEVKQCPECQRKLEGSFPQSVKAPVQYGVRLKAISAYLYHQHFLPENRLSEIVEDLFGCSMSEGTIANHSKSLAQAIIPTGELLASRVKTAPVKHLSERYPQTIAKSIETRLNSLYQSIIRRGLDFHLTQPPLARNGNRERVKRRVGHNLLLRLQNFAEDVLRFLYQVDIPFTNN